MFSVPTSRRTRPGVKKYCKLPFTLEVYLDLGPRSSFLFKIRNKSSLRSSQGSPTEYGDISSPSSGII